jgi:hypothetical protein
VKQDFRNYHAVRNRRPCQIVAEGILDLGAAPRSVRGSGSAALASAIGQSQPHDLDAEARVDRAKSARARSGTRPFKGLREDLR